MQNLVLLIACAFAFVACQAYHHPDKEKQPLVTPEDHLAGPGVKK